MKESPKRHRKAKIIIRASLALLFSSFPMPPAFFFLATSFSSFASFFLSFEESANRKEEGKEKEAKGMKKNVAREGRR